nr:zinc finger MYND domain-containing protein 11 isoform X7 [Parasteatoda tepidariorum]
MRPRGTTQRLYNEAIQILSGTRVKKQSINSELNETPKSMAVKRRQACTQTVLHLWDAIAYIKQQKQIANLDRLANYMKRVYSVNPSDVEQQLNFAVEDGLINIKRSIGCKGSKVGLEQDGYRIPEEINEKDGHDWYCFECHLGGEVILCTTCFRVFHEECLPNDFKTTKLICPVCKSVEKFSLNVKKSELNTLLGFTCVRLKEKTRELHRIPHPDDEKWRFNFLIYQSMDLTAIEDKMKSNEYSRLADFFSDTQQIVHNVVVYFGVSSRIAEMARQMLGDCEYDLLEIIQCSHCYKMSNTKVDSWFCSPCDPPHELVYAKVKGFPYWPAKVIKKEDNYYDVRFFGAFHQRALIHQDHVKPVSTPYKKLGIKYTPSFDRAYKELCHHQKLVEAASRKRSSGVKSNSDQTNAIDTKNETVNEVTDDSSSKLKATPLRKRKCASTPLTKPPSAKKAATVPVKKNKKFYQESPTSSSPKISKSENASLSEDHDLVSSSQDTSVFQVTVAVQTPKEFLLPRETEKNNNEFNEKAANSCNCTEKYDKRLKDLQTRLETEHKEEKSKSLKELSDKIHREMESEKQKTLSVTLEKFQQEQKEAQIKVIEQLKLTHAEEMCKMVECHNKELSEAKKKQWCYNCEAEAIYHCCWNTSYCSVECQQVHWHKEHKRTCRRKR